jgi:proprotein convertase subtilisin/kexin type 5
MDALTDPDPANRTCETSCPSDSYADETLRACIACHADCTTCFGSSNKSCILCKAPNYTFSGRCFADPL